MAFNIESLTIKGLNAKTARLLFLAVVVFLVFYLIAWLPLADSFFDGLKSLLFILMGMSFFVYSYIKYEDMFSPLAVYNLLWFFILAIGELKLSALQGGLGPLAYALIFGSIMSFNLGASLFGKKGFVDTSGIEYIEKRKNNLLLAILLFFIASFSAAVIESANSGFLFPFLSGDRNFKYINYLHYLTMAQSLVMFLCFVFLRTFKTNRKTIYLIFVLAIIQAILFRNRWVLFMPVIGCFMYVNKYYGIKAKQMVTLGLMLILLLVGVGSVRMMIENVRIGASPERSILTYGHVNKTGSQFLGWLNTYTVMSVQNFQNNIEQRQQFDKGLNTFGFILDLTLLDRLFNRENLGIDEKQLVYSGLGGNIVLSTYLGELYADFGPIWVLIVPMFYGLFCGLMYRGYRSGKSMVWSYIYGIVLTMIIFSAFSSYFSRSGPFVFMLMASSVVLILRLRLNILPMRE